MPPLRAGAPPGSRGRILAVEDNAVNKKVITRFLEKAGFQVDVADNGLQAVAAVARGTVTIGDASVAPELLGIHINLPATVAVLKLLGPYLATVHAQNETLAAFDGPARLALLDTFACSQLACVQEAFHHWKEIRTRIEELERDEQDRVSSRNADAHDCAHE